MATIVRLAAVQPRWRADDYADAGRFAARVRALVERAVADAPGPALVAFPELWALPLLATGGGAADALRGGLGSAVGALARRRAWRWLAATVRDRRRPWRAVYADLAVDAYRIWVDAFAEAARATGATLAAGTGFFPTVAYEAARGWHVADPRPTNLALLVGPGGRVVARASKVHLTAGLESRVGLARGRVEDLPVVATPVGRVALAVCLDGWYHHVLERLDGAGAQILVQPSANDAAWERPWPPDPTVSEGDAWLRRGLAAGLVGRQHLRYGVNPMLVGDLAPLAPRGRSTVVARRAADDEASGPPDGLPPGVLAIAPEADAEAVVVADVAHPDDA